MSFYNIRIDIPTLRVSFGHCPEKIILLSEFCEVLEPDP